MERPVFNPLGTSVLDLDTPALTVDLDVMGENIETLHSFFHQSQAKIRPYVGVHKCPAIAHKQMAAGGTVGGIMVATIGEAEVFAQHGFTDITVASRIVTRQKIDRLCALARTVRMNVSVDNPENVGDLSTASRQAGVSLNVLVEVHTRLERGGVDPGLPAVTLARAVVGVEHLHFAGFMTYEGAIICDDPEELHLESQRCARVVLETKEMAEGEGIRVDVVSLGNTSNYEIVGKIPGITEVTPGSYALIDYRYVRHSPRFKPAAKVLSTVTSHPDPGTGIIDAGQKAIGMDTGMAVVEGLPGASLLKMSAEHGSLSLEGDLQRTLEIGDHVWLIPWDIGVCTNLYNYIFAVRNGTLENIWEISARGRYR